MVAAVAVVGARRGIGKTRLVETIVRWLVNAGFKVQFVKRSDHEYASSGKDNERAFSAGAERAITVFKGAAQALERGRELEEYLAEWDGVTIVEGFREREVPKIVVAQEEADLSIPGAKGPVIAVVAPSELRDAAERAYPGARFFATEEVASMRPWLLERLGHLLLATTPRRGCKACGFSSCAELVRTVAAGKARIDKCIALSEEVIVKVNSKKVPLSKFPADVVKAVCTALIAQLRLQESEIRTIEIKIRASE